MVYLHVKLAWTTWLNYVKKKKSQQSVCHTARRWNCLAFFYYWKENNNSSFDTFLNRQGFMGAMYWCSGLSKTDTPTETAALRQADSFKPQRDFSSSLTLQLAANTQSQSSSSHNHSSCNNPLPPSVFIYSLFTSLHVSIAHTTIREMTQQTYKLVLHSVYCCFKTRQINSSVLFGRSHASKDRKEVPRICRGSGHMISFAAIEDRESRGGVGVGGGPDVHGDCDSCAPAANRVRAVQFVLCGSLEELKNKDVWKMKVSAGGQVGGEGSPLPLSHTFTGPQPVSWHYLSGQWCVARSLCHWRKRSDWLEAAFYLTEARSRPHGLWTRTSHIHNGSDLDDRWLTRVKTSSVWETCGRCTAFKKMGNQKKGKIFTQFSQTRHAECPKLVLQKFLM